MSSPDYAVVPASFSQPKPTSFTITSSTLGKVVVDQQGLTPVAGGSTNPAIFGGCTVIDLYAASTDATARDVQLYTGTVLTTQGTTPTGTMTTTTSTITRASGSFIADGWLVGDLVMTFAPAGTAPNASQDGVLGVVTGVAALTLTVNGTPFAALTLATGTRIVAVAPRHRSTVAITAGTANSASNVGLLGSKAANDGGTSLGTELKLGPNNLLIAAMPVAVSALPAAVSIQPVIAAY